MNTLTDSTNLTLAEGTSAPCDERTVRGWLTSGDEDLAASGAIGLGRLIAAGRGHLWPLLREAAHDPRPAVREGAVTALRQIADADLDGLLDELERWVDGSAPLRQAAVAGLAGHGSATDPVMAHRVTLLVDRITWTLRHEP